MKDNRSRLQIYTAAVKRLIMWYVLPKRLEIVLVPEFPKSGGSWLCQMLSEATGLPYPRNVSPKFEKCILHGHHLYHPKMGKSIAVVRDGRDVMVSAYFHFLFKNDRNKSFGVKYHRDKLQFDDYDNVKSNMPEFISYMFTNFAQKNFLHFSWSDFVQNVTYYSENICLIKYEDLLDTPVKSLEKALNYYDLNKSTNEKLKNVVQKYSFENITNRNRGEEDKNSFVRKGISGDWKNYFTKEACQVFKKHAGEELIVLDYEKDHNWTI
jgi:hypothetical protein